jgi:hypothetical protein
MISSNPRNAIKLQVSSLGKLNTEFITSINSDKITQLNKEYYKDRPKPRPMDTYSLEEEVKKIEPPQQKPPSITPPYSHYIPPMPYESIPIKKEDEKKGPSALERAMMESSRENQESSTLEKLVQEKVCQHFMLNLVPI